MPPPGIGVEIAHPETSTPMTVTPTVGNPIALPDSTEQPDEFELPHNFRGFAVAMRETTVASIKLENFQRAARVSREEMKRQERNKAYFNSFKEVSKSRDLGFQKSRMALQEDLASKHSTSTLIADKLDSAALTATKGSTASNTEVFDKLDELKKNLSQVRAEMAIQQDEVTTYSQNAVKYNDILHCTTSQDLDKVHDKINNLAEIIRSQNHETQEAQQQYKHQFNHVDSTMNSAEKAFEDLHKTVNNLATESSSLKSNLEQTEIIMHQLQANSLASVNHEQHASLTARVESDSNALQMLMGKVDGLEQQIKHLGNSLPTPQIQSLCEKVDDLEKTMKDSKTRIEQVDTSSKNEKDELARYHDALEKRVTRVEKAVERLYSGYTTESSILIPSQVKQAPSSQAPVQASDAIDAGVLNLEQVKKDLGALQKDFADQKQQHAMDMDGLQTKMADQNQKLEGVSAARFEKVEGNLRALQAEQIDQIREFKESFGGKLEFVSDGLSALETTYVALQHNYDNLSTEELCLSIIDETKKLYGEHPGNVLDAVNDLRTKQQHMDGFLATIDPRMHNIGIQINAKANSEALKPLSNRIAKLEANVNKTNTSLTGISRELVQGIRAAKELLSNEEAEPEGVQIKDAIMGLCSALKQQLNSLDADLEEALMKIEFVEEAQRKLEMAVPTKGQENDQAAHTGEGINLSSEQPPLKRKRGDLEASEDQGGATQGKATQGIEMGRINHKKTGKDIYDVPDDDEVITHK